MLLSVLIPKSHIISLNTWEENCGPLSERNELESPKHWYT